MLLTKAPYIGAKISYDGRVYTVVSHDEYLKNTRIDLTQSDVAFYARDDNGEIARYTWFSQRLQDLKITIINETHDIYDELYLMFSQE